MWKECQMKEKSQESINGSHLPLDQKEDQRTDGKMMWEWICRKWRSRIGRGMYWTETHGGQLLSGPKLIKSCSVYQKKKEKHRFRTKKECWRGESCFPVFWLLQKIGEKMRSQDSIMYIVTSLCAGQSRVRFLAGARNFFPQHPDRLWGPSSHLIQWVLMVISQMKGVQMWSWPSPLSSSKVKKKWNYTSAPPCMPSWHAKG